MKKTGARRFSKVKRFLLLTCTILLVLITTEIVVQLFFPFGRRTEIFDPVLQFRLPPNATFLETNMNTFVKEFVIKRTLNEYGYNDELHNISKSSMRIMFIGDSFTYGWGIPREKNFVSLLGKKLDAEVMNFALPRIGIEQGYANYLYENWKFSPDLVIYVFFVGNDIDQKQELFNTSNGTLVPQRQELPPLQIRARRYLASTFQSYAAFVLLLQRIPTVNSFLTKIGLFQDSSNVDIFALHNNAEYENNLKYIELLLDKFKQAVEENNASFAIVLLPPKEQVDDTLYDKYYSGRQLQSTVDRWRPQKDLARIARKHDIKIVDLLPAFIMLNKNNTFYYTYDGHFNEKGHALTAELLFR